MATTSVEIHKTTAEQVTSVGEHHAPVPRQRPPAVPEPEPVPVPTPVVPRFEEPLTYSIAEAVQILGCSENWLRNRVNNRDLPYVRLGRRVRFTGPQLLEILQVCTERPLPGLFFANPNGLASGSPELLKQHREALEQGRTLLTSMGRRVRQHKPVRGRQGPFPDTDRKQR